MATEAEHREFANSMRGQFIIAKSLYRMINNGNADDASDVEDAQRILDNVFPKWADVFQVAKDAATQPLLFELNGVLGELCKDLVSDVVSEHMKEVKSEVTDAK